MWRGLLADYNTAYAAAWLVVRLTSRSDQSDVVSTRFDIRIGSRTKSNIRPSVRPVERSVYKIRSSDRPIGPKLSRAAVWYTGTQLDTKSLIRINARSQHVWTLAHFRAIRDLDLWPFGPKNQSRAQVIHGHHTYQISWPQIHRSTTAKHVTCPNF